MMFLPVLFLSAAFVLWTFLFADIRKDEKMNQYYEEVSDLYPMEERAVVYSGYFDLNQFDYDRKVS